MSDSVRSHRQQPTRLPCPWDSPGKNTGVGCHFLLHCMTVKSESEVIQSCPTLRYPMDCSSPVSSIHGILQAKVLEWGAIAYYLVSSLLKLFKNHNSFKWFSWLFLNQKFVSSTYETLNVIFDYWYLLLLFHNLLHFP